MQLRLLRHATIIVKMRESRILVDPMFSRKGTLPPIIFSPNSRPNPLVELPLGDAELAELLNNIDGVIVTHTHVDHFDAEAAKRIAKGNPVFCQPEDEHKIRKTGLKDVIPVTKSTSWKDITITRTGGRHGSVLINPFLGLISGFIFEMRGEPKVYVAGDTIWCKEIEQALTAYHPDIVVANTGAARLLAGGLITMSCPDIERISGILPRAKIVAVHLEAFNHCLLTREKMREYLKEKNLSSQVLIPDDGEEIFL